MPPRQGPPNYVASDALLSPCGTYRYWLSRRWDDTRAVVAFVMLNPSTADAEKDDPTIRCCVRLAKREGFGGIHVVNLFAFRTPDRETFPDRVDPIGPDNDRHIREAACLGAVTVVAWGEYVPVSARPRQVFELLREAGVSPKCIERLKGGQPRHPLYLRQNARLLDFYEGSGS
ncbi:MAG TPA: DUF1643 domain-containing protein [Urbifossiella sp.]|nr:DUF1643 domain-containing protein [Urbifossiella sp.]